MTAYAGDIIQLQPKNAAIYDVKVKRVISEGQEGVAGIYKYYVNGSVYLPSDGITRVGYIVLESTSANPNKYRSSTVALHTSTITDTVSYINDVCNLFNASANIKDIYDFSRDNNFLVATEKDGYYGLGAPFIYNQDSSSKKYMLMPYTDYVHKGKVAIPPEVEYIESPNTFVDRMGRLHIDKNLSSDDVIVVTIKSTYINPSGETEEFEEIVEITLD